MSDPNIGKTGTVVYSGLKIPVKITDLAPPATCGIHKGLPIYKFTLTDHCYQDASGNQIDPPADPAPKGTKRIVLKNQLWQGCLTCHQFT